MKITIEIIVLHPESSLDLNLKKIGKIYPIGRIGVLKKCYDYILMFLFNITKYFVIFLFYTYEV